MAPSPRHESQPVLAQNPSPHSPPRPEPALAPNVTKNLAAVLTLILARDPRPEPSAPSRIPADSLSQTRPDPDLPDTIRGPSPDHYRKPSLNLSSSIPAPNLPKTFAPTWTLTPNPAPDPQPSPARPDPNQGPRPDHHCKPSLSLSPTHWPQTPAFSPCPSRNTQTGPRPQPPACHIPDLPQLVPDPKPNPKPLSRPR
eukprot:g16168.t1